MWSLETIIALNERASKLAAEGRPITEAYRMLSEQQPSEADKKPSEPEAVAA